MKRVVIIGFIFLMSFDTFGQLSFKLASINAGPLELDLVWFLRLFTKPWVYGAILGYLGAFVTWMTILKYAPMGPAFAASHLELISVSIFSVWLLGESMNVHKIIGGTLIILGVFCLARGEEQVAREQQQA